jgi:hypothetical protein
MKREIKTLTKQIAEVKASKQPQIKEPHHQGKGTPARINTAAEKHFFGSKFST